MAMTLFAIVLPAIIGPTIILTKSNIAMGNYAIMSDQSRRGIDQMGIDLRSTVDVTSAGASGMTIVVEDPDEVPSTIVYAYDSGNGTLSRKVGVGAPKTIVENLTALSFSYYDSTDTSTANIIDMKKVELSMTLNLSVMQNTQTHEFRSARFVLRNRPAG